MLCHAAAQRAQRPGSADSAWSSSSRPTDLAPLRTELRAHPSRVITAPHSAQTRWWGCPSAPHMTKTASPAGGEQQRLRIAQALVSHPELLLADEPLLSLDLASQQTVTGLIDARRRTAGTPVMLVTRDINPILPLVDRVLYLAPGASSGSPELPGRW